MKLHRCDRFLRLLVLGVLISVGMAHAQLPELSRTMTDKLPEFMHGQYFFAGKDGAVELRLIHQISYDALSFLKAQENFQSQYELAVQIEDKQGDVQVTRILNRHITVAYFEETVSNRDFDSAEQSFMLAPGTYYLSLSLTDRYTQKTARQKIEMSVPDLSKDEVNISSLVFGYMTPADSSGEQTWKPYAISQVPEDHKHILLRFDIYNRAALTSMPLNYRLVGAKKKSAIEETMTVSLEGEVTHQELALDLSGLESGSYLLRLELGDGKWKIKKDVDLVLHVKGLSVFAGDLSSAIEMLAYIADGKEMKAMRKASGQEQKEMLLDFWLEKDPTPLTPSNELMDEYYRRAAWCNRFFGVHREGWRTDRGRIYILLGPPDDVVRRPNEPNIPPIEIWYYNRFNRDFVFMDENGYGEYRLLTENYDIWY